MLGTHVSSGALPTLSPAASLRESWSLSERLISNGALSEHLTSTGPTEAAASTAPANKRLLLFSFCILFTRYVVCTFLSAFFSVEATRLDISDTMNGVIFAAYPMGMSITSCFAAQTVRWLGTRTAVLVGLVSTTVLTLLFGFGPDMCAMPGLQALFFVSYFFNGLCGAFAETACIMMVAHRFKDRAGTVMAAVNTVCTVGAMVGPQIGGGLHDVPSDEGWQFRLPFLVMGFVPLALLPFTFWFMPQEYIGEDAEEPENEIADGAPAKPVLSDADRGRLLLKPSVLLGFASIGLSGTLVGTLDPTLSYRLSAPPFSFSDTQVGFFFTYSSLVYIVVSIPIGRVADAHKENSRLFKAITSSGFVALFLTFALLAPIGPSAWGITDSDGLQSTLNNQPSAYMSLVLKGVGSALSNLCVYPDLMVGMPDDVKLQATISSMWNAAYAVGWAAGPLLGSPLYSAFKHHSLCLIGNTEPVCGANGTVTADCCYDYWRPYNGFDGFGTIAALLSLAYAVVLSFASCCGSRPGRKPASVDPELQSPVAAVEPLQAARLPDAAPAGEP